MTRPSPFAACLIHMQMGLIPEDPEGMKVVGEALGTWKNGGEKVFDAQQAAERNRQLVSHYKLLVKLEKR